MTVVGTQEARDPVVIPRVASALVVIPAGIDRELLDAPVGGVPLLQRTILALRRRGIRRVLVIGLEGLLPTDRRFGDLDVAVAVAGGIPDTPQLVLPGNLVWDDKLLARILDGRATAGGLAVCPDRERAREHVERIRLGERLDVVSAETVLIRSVRDLAAAGRLLIRTAGKNTDGIVSRYVNRRVSQAITRLLVGTPVTPNAVTVLVLLVGVAAAVLVLSGGYARTALGSVFFVLNSVFDGVDGELARVRFQETPTGAWLDRLSDKLVMLLFFGAVFARLLRTSPPTGLKLAAEFSIAGFAVGLPLVYLYGHLRKRQGAGALQVPGRGLRRWGDLAAFEVVFGGVLFRDRGDTGENRGPLRQALSSFSLLLKNDVLATVFLALGLAGQLPAIFWPLAPIGGGLIILAGYCLLSLVFDFPRGLRRV